MTILERATEAIDWILDDCSLSEADAILCALEEAVRAENEACAKLIYDHFPPGDNNQAEWRVWNKLLTAVRSRVTGA